MHPIVRPAVGLAAAVALLAPSQAFAGDHPSPGARAHLLTRAGHGAAVVEALGDKLPAAAATNRMSASRLAEIVESDRTAWIGADGQLFYKEATDTPAEAAAMTAAAGVTAATAAYPESQTFALHSNPASTHTIFLDFDGANVSGTWWNVIQHMDSRFYTGFTLDGDPSTFTSAELAYIQQVWQIVSEKYSPFDVDVTTQDPGPAGYDRSSSADQTYGDHVIISNDGGALTQACSGGCSGIALVSTFNDTWYTDDYLEPAWVFSSQTSGSAVLTAHTVAHEVGHTFGLLHDGVTYPKTEYYSGQANWFPIMGSSARAVGQFSMGEYSGANNTQDDLAVIASHGAPLRTDDRGDTTATASTITAGTLVDGVISTRADRDVFAVSHDCATNLTARATGIGAGASLDMSVTVLDAAGAPIASADPSSGQNTAVWPAVPTGMDASVTIPAAPSGTYYVRVDGVGKGSALTDGYSDYGSIGTYQLAVSSCDGTLPPPTSSVTTAAPAGPSSTDFEANAPGAPGIGAASSGRRGGPVTARARWTTPASNGGATIIGYRVRAELLGSSGRVRKVHNSRLVSAGSRTLTMRLAKGHYRFRIVAYNAAGTSPYSAPSRVVVAR